METALSRIGGYRLRREVGPGKWGVIYEAQSPDSGTEVILETLSPALLQPENLHRFLREAEAVAGLDHPNIVPVREVGHAGGVPFVVRDRPRGTPLPAVLRSPDGVSRKGACRMALSMTCALRHAHEMGIYHLDLGPSDILIAPDGEAKLTSLGLAHLHHGVTRPAPGDRESPAGQGVTVLAEVVELDTRIDVHSLGGVLQELLAVSHPAASREDHEAGQGGDIGSHIETTRGSRHPDDAVADFLRKATDGRPARRPRSLVPLMRALRTMCEENEESNEVEAGGTTTMLAPAELGISGHHEWLTPRPATPLSLSTRAKETPSRGVDWPRWWLLLLAGLAAVLWLALLQG